MLKMTEYAKRRQALMRQVGANSVVILPSANEISRNGDSVYHFRQSSDFYYLTGFDEPEAVLVLLPGKKGGQYILFNRVRDREREIWDGPRAGQADACNIFLADAAYPIQEFEERLPALLAGREEIHYPLGKHQVFDNLLMRAVNKMRSKIRSGLPAPAAFMDISPTLHEMRLYKSAGEIDLIQTAIDISAKGHENAMRACRPDMYEYELEAELSYQFKKHGARFEAYGSIVGAGKNTCVLHYVSNNSQINNGDLVLIDAGAEYQNYAADITRTFPANGKFSPEQRAIYEIVLAAQLAAIKVAKPNANWSVMQEAIVKVMIDGLTELGILKGQSRKKLIEDKAYFPYYMHLSGHWLGLDVHDAGRYNVNNKWRKLEPNMVFTIEPGIYLSSSIPGLHKRWHNIGIRIEDNIVVTKTGNRVLSADIPKAIDTIEACMAN